MIILDHLITKQVLKTSGLVTPNDYVRSVNNQGWTDFSYDAVNKIINNDSKYVITSTFNVSAEEHANILFYPKDLKSLSLEIKERFIDRKAEGWYDTKRNRIYCYFIDERTLQIGNKRSDFLKVELKPASLFSLIQKNDYLPYLDHTHLQWYLIILGKTLGFDVKVARNDRNRLVANEPLGKYATLNITGLKLPEILKEASKERIDLIDVVWFDRNDNRVFSAFEIELSDNIEKAAMRLAELKENCKYKFYSIIVLKPEDIKNLYKVYDYSATKHLHIYDELKYLTTINLAKALSYVNDLSYTSGNLDLKNLFFSKLLMDAKENSLL